VFVFCQQLNVSTDRQIDTLFYDDKKKFLFFSKKIIYSLDKEEEKNKFNI
jgi:hypothetical protein